MNNKREFSLIATLSVLLIIIAIYSINLVSAQPTSNIFENLDLGIGMTQIIYQMTEFFRPIFEFLLGPYAQTEFFYAKVLLLILLVVVIYWILDRVPLFQGYRNIAMIISLIVSIIAVRFISENQLINGILLPYGTIGVGITTILPFLIIAYGVHTLGLGGIGRKMVWGFFGLIFLILWVTKSSELSDLSNYIYIGTLIGVAVMLVFDRSIHAYFSGADMKRYERELADRQISDLQIELSRLRSSPATSNEIERRIRQIERRLRHFRSRSAAL